MPNGLPPALPELVLDAASAGDRHALHLAQPTHVLLAIADGTGTPEAIELGSGRALATLVSTYRELPMGTALTQRMMRAARNASFATYELAIVLPPLRDVGIMLTAVAVAGNQLAAAYVGTGRVYLRREGGLTQLSKDPTAAPCAEAALGGSPMPALGRELLVAIDFFEIELRVDDAVMLCNEGVHRVLADDAIDAELARRSAGEACRALLDRARGAGAVGELSVAVVRPGMTPAVAGTPRD